jgi:hypothetical protein
MRMNLIAPLTRPWPYVLVGMLLAAACGSEPTIDEVETLLTKQFSNQFSTARYDCQDGEGDYRYVCQVRYEPTPQAVWQGARPSVKRVGVSVLSTLRGTAGLSEVVLPDTGPVPSLEQLAALRKEEEAKAAARSNERLKRALSE